MVLVGLFSYGCVNEVAHKEAPLSPNPKPVIARKVVEFTEKFSVPVLMYHRIDDLDVKERRSPLLRDLTVSPRDFEDQVSFLVSEGYSILLASDIESAVMEKRHLPKKAIAITLDDGYKDNFEHAFPILKKYSAPATIFLVTSNFGRKDRLSWNDVLTMRAEAGFGYGSHSVHHYDLTTLDRKDLDHELTDSKRLIEFKVQDPITSIAYPAGSYNDFVRERARAAGYLAGWKKGGGLVTPKDDMLMLPRVRVSGRTTLADFKRKIRF
jgi:peptidoglycan/xylan/chitin deacetylase (PgdA/CDA1 family)